MDVHVIGGGPAGSIAAVSAARTGFNVVVSEEHEKSGSPSNCSGLFSKEGIESLGCFFDYRKFVLNRVRGAVIDFSGEKIKVSSKDVVGVVCDREKMDEEISGNAESEGVKFEYCKRIKGVYHSDNIIGADGPSSGVAGNFNFPKIKKYVGTFQADARYYSENPDFVEIFISSSFPGFFGWVIPKNEETAELGCGVVLPNSPRDAFKELLKIKGVERTENEKGWTIPIKWREKTAGTFGNKNVLLVGDAAGQTKATTGGGIVFGGNCAAIAGENADDPEEYERKWKRKFGVDLFIHQIIQNHLEGKTDDELRRLGRWIKELKLDDYLSRKGHMDKPTRMVRPELLVHFLKNL